LRHEMVCAWRLKSGQWSVVSGQLKAKSNLLSSDR
jgi:hypothetical protein